MPWPPVECGRETSTPSSQKSWLEKSVGARATTRSSSLTPPAWRFRMWRPRRSCTSARLRPVAEHLSASLRFRPGMLPQSAELPVAETEEKTEEPPLFRVLLHNDDYTTMDFVVQVLQSVFNMPEDQAIQIMLNVHVKGIGVAGVYTYEVAEMKVAKTTAMAREYEFPLLCTIE